MVQLDIGNGTSGYWKWYQYICSIFLSKCMVTGKYVSILLCLSPALRAIEVHEEDIALINSDFSLSTEGL